MTEILAELSPVGLLVVSIQEGALSTADTVIEKTIRQCSRETGALERRGDRANVPFRNP